MAKKNKAQLTPEELAEKKLKKRKGWARVGAVACALAITAAVYAVGAKDGHKIKQVEETPQVVTQVVKVEASTQKTETTTEATTKAAETTTKAAETTTKASSDSSSDGGILDTITGLLGGLGDIGSLGDMDFSGAGDTIEGVGNTAKDFFYDIADKIENGDSLGDIGGDIGGDIIGGLGQ
jgi:hypothetical protein